MDKETVYDNLETTAGKASKDWKVTKSEDNRIVFACKNKDCNWRVGVNYSLKTHMQICAPAKALEQPLRLVEESE